MSVLVPLVKKGITFNEVPDKMAVYLELGDCFQGCKGCHSPELSKCMKLSDYTDSDDIRRWVVDQIDSGANAIVVLGGTTASLLNTEDLIYFLRDLAQIAPVCLYSGSDFEATDKMIADQGDCTWLKTGSYKEELGGLDNPKTNQRFYKIEGCYVINSCAECMGIDVEFIDETYKFRQKEKNIGRNGKQN